MNISHRNNVSVLGKGSTPIMFAHGFGCDQNMWRYVVPAFENDHSVVLFDHVGAGKSDLSAYDRSKYDSLVGYADDIIEIIRDLGLKDVIFVGHSVSAMMGVIAAKKAPDLFKSLVLVGPSPCYLNDGDYEGGFSKDQIEELMESLDRNHLGWSMSIAPAIMGNPDRPELGQELANSFCHTDPEIAKHFARVTFLTDCREDLEGVAHPALILQCSEDVIAPQSVGEYVHAKLPNSKLVIMDATGHCPNLSAPDETVAEIRAFIDNG